jgi:nucleotide-binding universal stress UspA family protein
MRMVSTLLVPLDGSSVAEAALEPAVRLAHVFGAELLLFSSTLGESVEPIQAYLTGVADHLDLPRGVTTATAEVIWPAPAIVDAVEGRPDTVLVMATHGRGGFGRLALGSVADEVVGDVSAPVVLVGAEAKLTDFDGRRMVLAWEGIDIQPDLLATATAWAQALDLEVTVLHVRRPNVDDYGASPFPEWQAARHQVIDQLTAVGVRAGALIIDGLDVADEIVEYARTTPTALIAMGCRRHAHQRQGPLDNVVLKTVRHAPCPILVQSPRDQAGDVIGGAGEKV